MTDIISTLARELNVRKSQVESAVKLIDEGCTIPFIARYRKEATGELDDQVLRELHERLIYLRAFEDKKNDIFRIISEQGNMTDEISAALERALSLQDLEDIYRPFKPKRRTRASIAREKGLSPLADILLEQAKLSAAPEELAIPFINEELRVVTTEDALNGACDIIAELISDNPDYRKKIREQFLRHGKLTSKGTGEEDSVYRMYYDYQEQISQVAAHRILAIDRGEKEKFLKVSIETSDEAITNIIKQGTLKRNGSLMTPFVERASEDSYSRLVRPSIENEIRNHLTGIAQEHAIKVFAENLRSLLLQPPVKDRVVLGMDPAYRTGCKLAVVDGTGKALETGVIYPTPPVNKVEEAEKVVTALIKKYNVDIISIGNGTASRETEIFAANLIKKIDKEIYYMVVNEAGASVYSASKLASKEFPDFDVSLRSAVSIARRLQDPLAELVKIDPKAIGVGQYQHDMNPKKLDETLASVVEDCVNSVGVDLNTASPALLSHISGINAAVAGNIVEYRELNGRFNTRKELLKVAKLGAKAFEQCAGFLRIQDGASILDNTSVHPESYAAAGKLLEKLGGSLKSDDSKKIAELAAGINSADLIQLAETIGVGLPTLRDIAAELRKPGRDPRDELPKPLLRTDILGIEDLKQGMIIEGTVRNVASFGAFVDIGVHQDGLVHISEMRDKFVKNPMEVVSVGDIVKVRVKEVDAARKRISLSMRETST